MIKIDRIDHLVLTVSSIANTCDFYCDILAMDRYSRTHLYDHAIRSEKRPAPVRRPREGRA